MKKTMLKWFTLIEMMIVMIIIGILAIVLTESYLTISRVALKIEQEKNLSEESLVLTQIFQAIADEATIDYDAYGGKLKNSDWFTDKLYLTWEAWSWTTIYVSGEHCLELDWNFASEDDKIENHTWCTLILENKQWKTQLTSPWKVVISKVKFRVIPYDSDNSYFEGNWSSLIRDLHQPAFWMFIHLYSPIYKPKWTNKIDQPLQLFFNLKL